MLEITEDSKENAKKLYVPFISAATLLSSLYALPSPTNQSQQAAAPP